MPRCPAHCPPRNSGPLLPAAIIAGACTVAATWTVIVHVLTILVITFGVVAGLGAVGLAAAVVLRLRALTRTPQAPARTPRPWPRAMGRPGRRSAADHRQPRPGSRLPAGP